MDLDDNANSYPARIERDEHDYMYLPGEKHFAASGPPMAANGWAVYPQDRDERRRPSRIDGTAILWSKYHDTPPSAEEIKRWSIYAATSNTAIILGPPSGNTICLDCDITEEALSFAVREVAATTLGHTPFRRVGTHPKVALFYRMAADELPRYQKYTFVKADGVSAAEDMIEVLARGRSITAEGVHHRTGNYFTWLEANPILFGPELAPLITVEQLDDFLMQVQDLRSFYRNSYAASANEGWEYTNNGTLYIPKLRRGQDSGQYTEDPVTGLVTDGREAFLFQLTRMFVQTNPGKASDPDGIRELKGLVFDTFKDRAAMTGKWSEGFLREQVNTKVEANARKLREGILRPFNPSRRPLPNSETDTPKKGGVYVRQADKANGDPLGFYSPLSQYSLQADVDVSTPETVTRGLDRQLIPDRTQISQRVQEQLTTALGAFFDVVYAPDVDPDAPRPIHLIKAPTGAGKTTRTIRYIAEDARTKRWDNAGPDNPGPGPIVFTLPTYNNIDELRAKATTLNLDPKLSDAELAAQALEIGLLTIDDAAARIIDLRRDAINAGLKTMVYRGKIAAGCLMADKVRALMDAGIGTAGLCHAKVRKKDQEPEDKYCIHYTTCPAIQQRKMIAESHVVFLPHSFLTLNIPEELKQVRAVVADERIFTLFLHTTTFYLATLWRGRQQPTLTRKEREQGRDPLELMRDRDEAAHIASEAFKAHRDVARSFAEYAIRAPGKIITGLDLVTSAARVCGSAISADTNINPDMTSEEITQLCQKPTGAEIREEYRFWKLLEERIGMLIPDMVLDDLEADKDAAHHIPRQAKGDRDYRIQHLKVGDASTHQSEQIRISWRTEPNWNDAPLLLLDASADPDITSKIFKDRPVVVHDIDAPLNVRTVAVVDKTYSNHALVAKYGSRPERAKAAKTLTSMRALLSAVSSIFGYGRVVVGSTTAVRRGINSRWAAPDNLDFTHYGALRGLDFAKFHSAAVSIGRMEVPVRTIDGIVAALTYDDETPEEPFDRGGDGIGPDGRELILPYGDQKVRLRSGQDAIIKIPMFPGRWASIVQKQYREEELRQFVGRLRPVYREGEAPTWIAVSKVIPEGIIVDDILSLDQLLNYRKIATKVWEAIRIADGVVDARVLFAASPHAFKNEEGVLKTLKRIGFNFETGVLNPNTRLLWGFTPIAIEDHTGARSYVFVRTEHRDPAQTVEKTFLHLLHETVRVVEILDPVRPRVIAQRREADWLSKEMGTFDQRLADERSNLAETMSLLVQHNAADIFAQPGGVDTLPIGIELMTDEDTKQREHMDVFDLATMVSTEIMWTSTKEGHVATVTSPVLPVGPGNFDNLGDGTYDVDGG